MHFHIQYNAFMKLSSSEFGAYMFKVTILSSLIVHLTRISVLISFSLVLILLDTRIVTDAFFLISFA